MGAFRCVRLAGSIARWRARFMARAKLPLMLGADTRLPPGLDPRLVGYVPDQHVHVLVVDVGDVVGAEAANLAPGVVAPPAAAPARPAPGRTTGAARSRRSSLTAMGLLPGWRARIAEILLRCGRQCSCPRSLWVTRGGLRHRPAGAPGASPSTRFCEARLRNCTSNALISLPDRGCPSFPSQGLLWSRPST